MDNKLILKNTTSLFPVGYKVKGHAKRKISSEDRAKLWEFANKFAQDYCQKEQFDICGYQNIPQGGTLLSANWNGGEALRVLTAVRGVHGDDLKFEGKKMAYVGKEAATEVPVTLPEKFFFGVEYFEPRRRFLFGIAPTMIEQLGFQVTGDEIEIGVLARALKKKEISYLPKLDIWNIITR